MKERYTRRRKQAFQFEKGMGAGPVVLTSLYRQGKRIAQDVDSRWWADEIQVLPLPTLGLEYHQATVLAGIASQIGSRVALAKGLPSDSDEASLWGLKFLVHLAAPMKAPPTFDQVGPIADSFLQSQIHAGPSADSLGAGLEEIVAQAFASRKWTDPDGIREKLQHGKIADVTQDFPVAQQMAKRAGLAKGQALLVPWLPMIGQRPQEPGGLTLYAKDAHWKETLARSLNLKENPWIRLEIWSEQAQGGLVIGDRAFRENVKGFLLPKGQAFLEVDQTSVALVTTPFLLQLQNEGYLAPGTILLIQVLYRDNLTQAILIFV